MPDEPDRDPEPGGEDDLPEDAQRLVNAFREGVRDDVNSILDERLRVNEPDEKTDKESEPVEPPRSRSLAERLGFGG